MIIVRLQWPQYRKKNSLFCFSDESVPTKCQYVNLVDSKCSGVLALALIPVYQAPEWDDNPRIRFHNPWVMAFDGLWG